jgi:hypothetical protein
MDIKMIDLDNKKPTVPEAEKVVKKPSFTVEKDTPQKSKKAFMIPLAFVLVAAAGFYLGAYLKTLFPPKTSAQKAAQVGIQANVPQTGVKVGDVFGSADEKAFNTTATGVLDKGGMNGEGTHKLVRPGGVSQTVYLTSSVIDLDSLVGHQVTIWGETFKGQKAGWLMDVGRVKVENLNAPLPK